MIRLAEALAFTAMAVALHLVAAGLLQARDARPAGAPGEPQQIAVASDALSRIVAGWQAQPKTGALPKPLPAADSPAIPDPEPAIAPAITPARPLPPVGPLPAVDQPEADTAPRIALPPLRPAMALQLALPTAAPKVPSGLLLDQSARPDRRPATRTAPVEPRAETRAEPQPRQSQPAQPARQAAPRQSAAPATARPAPAGGAGGGGGSGGGGGAMVPQLMAQWGARLSACIGRNARAPAGARRGGQVLLHLQIGRNGAIEGVSLARSSGNPALDQAAVEAARRSGRCPAAPEGLDQASYSFQLPVNPAR